MRVPRRYRRELLSVCYLLLGMFAASTLSAEPKRLTYGKPRELCKLADPEIRESSGVACSRLLADSFWTHPDSGGGPVLYLFSKEGKTLAKVTVQGAKNGDWEDICSFERDKKSYLLIGDVGDNSMRRPSCTLYLIEEPRFDKAEKGERKVPVSMAIPFKYKNGPRNCESISVDPTSATIYLVSKVLGNECHVYELPLPKEAPKEPLIAQEIATLKLPATSAMDISPDGLRAVILTDRDAYEYARAKDEPWAKAFARPPRQLTMPRRLNGEAICYGADGKTLYLTSEGVGQPFWEVPVLDEGAASKLPAMPERGLCAHRGASASHPQNTLAAFKEAVRLGAHQIEFDVHLTKDGHVVVIHDATVDATTDGKGAVAEMTLEQIRKLDAGIKKHKRFAGERIPTLAEALDCMPLNVWLNIHLKSGAELGTAVAKEVVKQQRQHQAILACGLDACESARKVDADLLICNMHRQGHNSAYVADTIKRKCAFIQIAGGFASAEDMTALKDAGVRINFFGTRRAGTNVDAESLPDLFKRGVHFPLVDDVEMMMKVAATQGIEPLKPVYRAAK